MDSLVEDSGGIPQAYLLASQVSVTIPTGKMAGRKAPTATTGMVTHSAISRKLPAHANRCSNGFFLGLQIAEKCRIEGRFLEVQGQLRTYRIHLGSSNILLTPNDQYLCIVPARTGTKVDRISLPFEGDTTLSVILSKAFLLVDDHKIKDPTIVSQIQCG